MRLYYLKDVDLDDVFEVVYEHYAGREVVPSYRDESLGIKQLLSLLQRIRFKYYPRFFDKATQLLIGINKGHYFSNGNKRLSLVAVMMFAYINAYREKDYSDDAYENKVRELFPTFTGYERHKQYFPWENAYYNLALIIADSHAHAVSIDELTAKTKKFLKFSLYK